MKVKDKNLQKLYAYLSKTNKKSNSISKKQKNGKPKNKN